MKGILAVIGTHCDGNLAKGGRNGEKEGEIVREAREGGDRVGEKGEQDEMEARMKGR